jgi:hypothetical protein
MNSDAATTFLRNSKFPEGIANSMSKNLARLPARFIIVDDSGSMMRDDGKMVRERDGVSRYFLGIVTMLMFSFV